MDIQQTPALTSEQTNPRQSSADLRMAFANWVVSPYRNPATQKEWAEQNGVAQSTLSDWKKTPEVQAVLKDWRSVYRTSFVEAVDAIWTKAKGGDVSAFRALADVLGENAPTKIEQTNKMTLTEFLSQATFGGEQ